MRVRLPRKSCALDVSVDSRLVGVAGEKLTVLEVTEDGVHKSSIKAPASQNSILKFSNVDSGRLAYSAGKQTILVDVEGRTSVKQGSAFERRVSDLSFNYFSAATLGVCAGSHFLQDTRSPGAPAMELSVVHGVGGSRGGCLSFHPLDRNVISTTRASSVYIFDIRKPAKPLNMWVAHSSDIHSIHWTSRNGGQLVTGSQEGAVIWKKGTHHFEEFRSIRTPTPVLEAQCAPFGDGLAVLSWQDPAVRVFNVHENKEEAPLVAFFPPLESEMNSVVRAFSFRRDPLSLCQQIVTLHDSSVMFFNVPADILLACRNHRSIEKLQQRGSIPRSPKRALSVSKLLAAVEMEPEKELSLMTTVMSTREELSIIQSASFACVSINSISLEDATCNVVLHAEQVVHIEFKVVFPKHYPYSASAYVDLVGDPSDEQPDGISSPTEYLKIFRALLHHHSKRQSNCMMPTCSTLSSRLVKQMAQIPKAHPAFSATPEAASPESVANSTSPFHQECVANLLRESVSNLGGGITVTSMSNVVSNGVIAALGKLLPSRLGFSAHFDQRYSSIIDGTSLRVMFNRLENCGDHSMFIIETIDGHVLGGYVSQALQPGCKNAYGTSEMFVFRVTSSGQLEHYFATGNSVYLTTPSTKMISFGCKPGFAICFTGTLEEGTTDFCGTFNCPPLCETSHFVTRCVEVFTIDDGLGI